MGEAANRGTYEERVQQAQIHDAVDKAEILIALHAENDVVHASFMPRDAEPDQDSLAMVTAAYINANWKQIAGEAMALYLKRQDEIHGLTPGQVSLPQPRHILDAQGNLARDTEDVPKIILPGGVQ